jgi:hypothetical protein
MTPTKIATLEQTNDRSDEGGNQEDKTLSDILRVFW